MYKAHIFFFTHTNLYLFLVFSFQYKKISYYRWKTTDRFYRQIKFSISKFHNYNKVNNYNNIIIDNYNNINNYNNNNNNNNITIPAGWPGRR